MWVIHQDILLSMPDAAPLPPNGKRVDLPDDFLANPRAYKVEGRRHRQAGAHGDKDLEADPDADRR